uniref:Uncharacterized protein n=1 Tax=Fagus sylvatica TaxID=28930 RepID=A0A2N9H2S5_FAGSY
MAERSEKIISAKVEPEIEKRVTLTASSKDEDANIVKKKRHEDEYRVISDLTSFDNLRAMYEAEAFMRKKRRESLKKGKENIVYCAEEVFVDAPKVEQSDKVQAVPTAEELETKSVEDLNFFIRVNVLAGTLAWCLALPLGRIQDVGESSVFKRQSHGQCDDTSANTLD